MRRARGARVAAAAAVVACLVVASSVGAQSPLSLVNVGTPVTAPDARMAGRGGWGLAESDSLTPAFKNLASLAGLRQVVLSLSGYGETIVSEGEEGERTNQRVMTPDVRAAVPLLGGRAVVTAGLLARRSTQYETSLSRIWLAGADTLASGDWLYIREGTQFAVPLGAAWQVSGGLALAASLNLERGVIRERVNHYYLEDLDYLGTYRPSSLTREDRLTGTSATLAIRAEPLTGLALGATWTSDWDADVERKLELTNVSGTEDSTFTLRMPRAWGVGAAYRFRPRWRAGVDYDRRDFSRFQGREDWARDMTDEWMLAFGCERERAQIRRGGWGNLPLRFGMALGRWGYRLNGEDVRELRVAAGTGFPFRANGGHLDVALSYARVGERERNGYEDRIWRLTVSIFGLEKW